jgi:hypothetical protein
MPGGRENAALIEHELFVRIVWRICAIWSTPLLLSKQS